MKSLNGRQSRALALGILAGLVAILVLAIALPVALAWSTKASAFEDLQFQAARLQNLASQQDNLTSQLRQARQRNPSTAYYVAGATPALAAANLQRYIGQVVDNNSGELISTQIDTSTNNGTSIDLSVHIKCQMQECFPILFGLESGKPMLFLDRMTITSRQIPARRPDQVPAVELDLRFTARSYLLETS